jgi:L-iditol 2-dehydrogenase
MKAVYLTKPGRLETRHAPDPKLRQATDVLLELSAVGICGSDLHYFRTGRIGSAVLGEPWIMGHECAAVVAEVGSAVSGLAVGDRVAVDPLIACGRCDQCRSGRKHTCREQHFLGCPGQQQGCLCERIVMPSECCFRVPEQLSVGAAVMVEPFAIALHAQRLLGGTAGKHIGILGAGPLAITDPLAYRLEMARQLGATSVHLLAPGQAESASVVEEILGQHPAGLDAVFDCSGEQDALDQAAALLAPGGTLLIVGIPEVSRVSFDINVLRRKELILKNVRRQNDCTDLAIELLGSGRVKLDEVITHRFDLSESQDAFELVANYRDGVAKALITF